MESDKQFDLITYLSSLDKSCNRCNTCSVCKILEQFGGELSERFRKELR